MSTGIEVAKLGYGEALSYGLIQGVTEFLPVSSSGHLKIAHRLGLGEIPASLEMPFDVLLHAATLIAITIAFYPDIVAATRRGKIFYVAMLASIVPAGLAGLFGGAVVQWVGESYLAVGLCYVYTAILLLVAQRYSQRLGATPTPDDPAKALDAVTLKQGIMVGGFQVLALLPGVSRSGSTVAAGLLGGMGPVLSVSYSFLVGLPLIAAAAGKDAIDGGFGQLVDAMGWGPIALAFTASVLSGLVSIALLKLVVGKQGLHWFSLYCGLVAIGCFILEGVQ
jgi:undecaprenyl-diphosphatase